MHRLALPLDVCGRAGLYLALRLGYQHQVNQPSGIENWAEWDVRGALQKYMISPRITTAKAGKYSQNGR